MNNTAAIFSGQGSQYVGMGADLVATFEAARALAARAESIVGFDLFALMADGPAEVLTQTRNTQPALFLHEAMVLACTGVGDHVACVAGHSLGEFSALHAAGVLDFDDALRLVHTRGTLMYRSGEQNAGTMAAVIGLDNDVVARICAEVSAQTEGVVVPANYNSPGQVVISGSAALIRSSIDTFKSHGARMVKELQVSGAFHSPLLTDVMDEWIDAVQQTPFQDARIPVYSNVTGKPSTQAHVLREAAIQQLVSPVLWEQTMHSMASSGINHFIEVGPQTVLQGLVKRTLPEATFEGLDKEADCTRYRESHSENGNV